MREGMSPRNGPRICTVKAGVFIALHLAHVVMLFESIYALLYLMLMGGVVKIEYRKLKESDLPDLYDIRFSVTENILQPHHIQYLLRAQVISDIRQGGAWLCVVDDVKIGFSMGLFIPEPIIGGLFVRPNYQKKGFGKYLLNLAVDWLLSNGAREISLTTDRGSFAEAFYVKQGWKKRKRPTVPSTREPKPQR